MLNNPATILIAILFCCTLTSHKPGHPHEADFLEFWTDIRNHYAYFHKKNTDWNKVKTYYLSHAIAAKSRQELITVFENVLEELYDNHSSLNTNLQTSTRLVPSGIDLWAEYINGKPIVTEVRTGFSAEKAGIKNGMEIISINGIEINKAVENRIGKCIAPVDTEVKNYALRQLLAGTYVQSRKMELIYNGKSVTIDPDKANGNFTDNLRYGSLLEHMILPNNTGYIKFNNSLGENNVIQKFDSALLQLKNTNKMIIDLRETPGGGNSTVARAIMSRFISKEMPYQKHVLPNEEKAFGIKRSWLELVSPRGPFTYQKPVVVLVNHWTGSMGEGIAIGFDALKRGKIVGTRMAGLAGAISGFQTGPSKIPFSIPTEQLFHVNGMPRESFVPGNLVDLTKTKYDKIQDPVLFEGLKMITGK